MAVKSEDEEAFQRAFSMLQPCYAAAAEAGVPRSQHQNLLTALHLMFLLVENRTAEFHMELELLSDVVQDPNVRCAPRQRTRTPTAKGFPKPHISAECTAGHCHASMSALDAATVSLRTS